jgi:hypothetical protein
MLLTANGGSQTSWLSVMLFLCALIYRGSIVVGWLRLMGTRDQSLHCASAEREFSLRRQGCAFPLLHGSDPHAPWGSTPSALLRGQGLQPHNQLPQQETLDDDTNARMRRRETPSRRASEEER